MSRDNDELRAGAVRDAQGAMRLHIAYIGVVGGLLSALHEMARGSAAALAEAAERDPGYVQRWCDAAYAFELLDEVEPGVFALSRLGEAFSPSTQGTLMPFAVQTILGAHMAERAAGLMKSGERPGERVLGERETVLPWFGPMLEASFGPFFENEILPGVPAFREVGERGGLAVDLGCGNGWYLRRLTAAHPRLRGIGLDEIAENITNAEARAKDEGLSDRLEFRLGDMHDFRGDEKADLIAMNRALHHVWNDKSSVFRILGAHLEPGGTAVIWEPAWPEQRSALRQPERRGVAFQNLSEHVQGNHFLRPQEIADALRATGLEPEIHLFANGREAVVTGRKPR